MKLELIVAFELPFQTPLEITIGLEARHFVLVLVGHQLEEITRNRFRERSASRLDVLFFLPHLVDECLVLGRVGRMLILRQYTDSPLDRLFKRS